MNNGKRVTLHYDEKYVQIPFLGDTKYFVTKVENSNITYSLVGQFLN